MGSIIISLKLKSGSKRETATLINGFDNYNKAQRERKRYMAQLSGLVASRERKQVRELEIHFIRIYFDHILEAKIAGKFHAAGESKSSVYYSPLAVISSGLNSVHGNRAVACFTNLQVDRIFFLVKSVSRSGEHCAVPAYVEQIRNPLRIPTKFLLSFGAQHFGTAAIINLSMHFGRWPRGSAITPSSEPFCNRNKSVSFGSTIVEHFQFIHGVFLPNDYRVIETVTPCACSTATTIHFKHILGEIPRFIHDHFMTVSSSRGLSWREQSFVEQHLLKSQVTSKSSRLHYSRSYFIFSTIGVFASSWAHSSASSSRYLVQIKAFQAFQLLSRRHTSRAARHHILFGVKPEVNQINFHRRLSAVNQINFHRRLPCRATHFSSVLLSATHCRKHTRFRRHQFRRFFCSFSCYTASTLCGSLWEYANRFVHTQAIAHVKKSIISANQYFQL